MIENARKLLKKYYGYPSFRGGQEKIISSILSGNDTFAIMPTGAGKSICFQIPALMFDGLTLVVSPLISLMKDQVDSLLSLGIPASFINSSLSYNEVNSRINSALNGEYKILYIAPERLESESFCASLNSLNISLLAIDEAHCVSQWGHDFRPSYRSVGTLVEHLLKRPIVAAFTATATEEVKEDVVKLLHLTNPNVFVTGFDRENLSFSVFRGVDKQKFIEKYIKSKKDQSGIIYCATRKEVDNIFEMLKKKGYPVGKYHAGMSDADRIKSQDDFLYDKVQIMAATNAFGMGIDKSNVRYVIHYNMPKNMESYYQEAGRAGRDGEPSECTLLFSPQDVMIQKFLIEQTTLSPVRRDNEYKKLQQMADYCHTQRCLRKYILEYFGEQDAPDECGNCSNCNDDSELSDITIEAQKIFSCILRMRQRFGITMIADVLKGSKNKKVLQMGFDSLSTYGIMGEYSVKEIKDLINFLIAEDYLFLSGGEYPIIKLKEKSGPVLKGTQRVFQKIRKIPKKVEMDNSLFDILKTLRRSIAERENVPPYIIFSDSTLNAMCMSRPVDEESMLSIKGVGEIKFQKYGTEFLNAIREYTKINNMPDTNVNNEIIPVFTHKPDKIPSHIVTLNMYNDGMTLDEIASSRGLNINTVQDHIIRCAKEGCSVNLDSFIPMEYEELIEEKINELGPGKLKPIKESLPDKISYMAIKAAICKHMKRTG